MNSIKIANTKVIDKVHNMLHHFNTYNFINFIPNTSIQLDFNSENLKEAIQREWMLTNLVCSDQPAFKFNSLNNEKNLKAAIERVKTLTPTVPFTLVQVDSVPDGEDFSKAAKKNSVDLLSNQFKNCNGTLLKTQTFCSPNFANNFFHKQQRERKIWWRKFSALPGRFQITQLTSDKESQFVQIQAEFPWGFETVEIIRYLPKISAKSDMFKVTSAQKKFQPQLVTCEAFLENITLTYLCDSYEGINEDTDRDMLRFNRKLAPYKVAFAGSVTSTETQQTLNELALLLAKKIRKNGFPVLLLPDMCQTDIKTQFLRNDGLGIPYTILLDERTLKEGMLAIRSRDTTLQEESHVSLLEPYVEKLMKSY